MCNVILPWFIQRFSLLFIPGLTFVISKKEFFICSKFIRTSKEDYETVFECS